MTSLLVVLFYPVLALLTVACLRDIRYTLTDTTNHLKHLVVAVKTLSERLETTADRIDELVDKLIPEPSIMVINKTGADEYIVKIADRNIIDKQVDGSKLLEMLSRERLGSYSSADGIMNCLAKWEIGKPFYLDLQNPLSIPVLRVKLEPNDKGRETSQNAK